MKYVMFERKFAGCPQRVPIIFPNCMTHVEVASAFKKTLGEPVSAGHLSSLDLSVEQTRGSESLQGLGPATDVDDEHIIQMHDYHQGLV